MENREPYLTGPEITLEEMKGSWNQVLDLLLEADRIAWLAFFDARLVSLSEQVLTINFSDTTKLGGDHNFSALRNPKHLALLKEAILETLGVEVEIEEI